MAIQLRRANRDIWLNSNVILAPGQPGVALDTGEVRVGNGVDVWANLPDAIRSADGKVRVESFGKLGTADDTAVFQAAVWAAVAVGAQVVVRPGAYNVENLRIPNGCILGPDSGSTSRFGLSIQPGDRKGSVVLRRPGAFAPDNTSTLPLVYVTGNGSGLRNVVLEGKGAPGTILEMGGFETVLENVRIISGSGIGLDVQRGNNTRWQNVFVDNCGGAATNLPAVKIWSKTGAGLTNETNTLDIVGLTIERSKNVALEIAVGATNTEAYAEWVRITDLHLESSYLDSQNVDPLIRIGNVRAVSFIDPFIYGGGGGSNGVLLRHEEAQAKSYGSGGIRFIGGTLLGPDVAAGAVPMPIAVDLVTGNDIAFIGTRFLRWTANAIRVASGYGSKVFVDEATYEASKNGAQIFMDDNRATKTTLPLIGNVNVEGHLLTTQSTRPSPANNGGATGAALLTNSTDTEGVVFFGTGASPAAGKQVTVTFNKPYARQPAVVVSAGNAATAALGLYVASNGTDFGIYTTNAPAANQAASTYQVQYHVLG